MSNPQEHAALVALRLAESLQSGLLFGNADEPLDAYGKRIVRVIQTALLAGASGGAGEADWMEDGVCLACDGGGKAHLDEGTFTCVRCGGNGREPAPESRVERPVVLDRLQMLRHDMGSAPAILVSATTLDEAIAALRGVQP